MITEQITELGIFLLKLILNVYERVTPPYLPHPAPHPAPLTSMYEWVEPLTFPIFCYNSDKGYLPHLVSFHSEQTHESHSHGLVYQSLMDECEQFLHQSPVTCFPPIELWFREILDSLYFHLMKMTFLALMADAVMYYQSQDKCSELIKK